MGRKGIQFKSRRGKFSPFMEVLSNTSWFGSLSSWDKTWESISQESTRRDVCFPQTLREIKLTPLPKGAVQEKKASSLGWAGPWAVWSAAFDRFTVLRVVGVMPFLPISLDYYRRDNTWIQLFSVKHALNGTYRVFPHQPITHVASSWHTQPACLLKKNTHTHANTARGRFLQLSCLSLSLQTLKKS